MKLISRFILATGMVFLPHLVQAQISIAGSVNNDMVPVRPDSIVQVAADSQGLQLVLPEQVPAFGTFWWVVPGGVALPTPCPPQDLSGAIYQIADGQFLVDETGGQVVVNPHRLGLQAQAQAQVTSRIVASAAVSQADALVNLITQVQTATEAPEIQTLSLAKGLGVPIPGDGSADGNGTNSSDATGYTVPDYGTNLWIAQVAVASGNLTGIGTNTQADIEYDILSRTNLVQTDWQTENSIFGSETTNWTPFSVAQNNRTNLFIRLRSDASTDGSGLPDWWELEYFGTNGVDPYGNPAGDGYSNLQKYQNGMNPNLFYTAPAPQGLTVKLNQTAQTASLSWLPSAGVVVSYTVEKSYQTNYWDTPVISDFTTTSTSYTDSLVDNIPDPWGGDAYQITYSVKANYSTSASSAVAIACVSGLRIKANDATINSSYWTSPVALQSATVSGTSVAGTNGEVYLEVAWIPANAVAVRLVVVFEDNSYSTGTDIISTNTYDIPVSSFTNGRYLIPPSWQSPVTDPSGYVSYRASVRSVDARGNTSAATDINGEWGAASYYGASDCWQIPFNDGRAQMKQNLIFQLRAAPVDTAFYFQLKGADNNDMGTFGAYTGTYNYPTNYVYAGLHLLANTYYSDSEFGIMDVYLPFEENCLFRNFIYNPADVDQNGNLTTGVENNNDCALTIYLNSPPTYQFQTNGMSLPNLLAANATRWLFYDANDQNGSNGKCNVVKAGIVNVDTDWSSYYKLSMPANLFNWFGLPYLSADLVYQKKDDSGNSLGLVTNLLNAGTTLSVSYNDLKSLDSAHYQTIYPQTIQPLFRTVKYCFYSSDYNWLPGSTLFTPTNDSPTTMRQYSGTATWYATNDLPFLIVPAGGWVQLSGYAKLEVTNSVYTGVYGYLGQYFDRAYKVDDNGNVTTNQTGVLSPYGYYFATDVGVAALVTMPDIDTGERGTCMVYSVSLQLDKNHDGTMDTSFNGPDVTSSSSPFLFWANNNFDRWALDKDDGTNYMDDVYQYRMPAAGCPYTPNTPTPDCNYCDQYGLRQIPCTRDLQDFFRLWVCGITPGLLTNLPAGSTITLNWGDEGNPNTGNPTIDLFQAVEADGGIGYLTNETVAMQQINPAYSSHIGRLGPGQSIQLNCSYWSGWAGNHFLMCGVSNGTGGLNLTIKDGNGNVLAQSTSYLQILDIKQMYERWTVGENPNVVPLTNALPATEDFPMGVTGFRYTQPQDTTTPYILYVHGWNMERWEKDRFAESAFKRLYWQGYKGRFGVFRWPTAYGFTGDFSQLLSNPQEKDNFDNSENNAWLASVGLLNKLNDLNAEYPGHVYVLAHSMGNVVTSEALRRAGNKQVVNTYVASQAAVSAQTYDATVANYSFWVNLGGVNVFFGPHTPNIYGNWFAGNNGGGAGLVINFYNVNDYALSRLHWQLDQLFKPDVFVASGGALWNYEYGGSTNDPAPWNYFSKTNDYTSARVNFDIVNSSVDHYEVFSHAAQSYTTALGATTGVNHHLSAALDLTSIWPSPDPLQNNYASHFWHSAEFRGDNPQQRKYWSELLGPSGFNVNWPFP